MQESSSRQGGKTLCVRGDYKKVMTTHTHTHTPACAHRRQSMPGLLLLSDVLLTTIHTIVESRKWEEFVG